MKKIIIYALIAVAVVGGVMLLKKDEPKVAANPTNHIVGKGTTGVTLVEFGDFQCPGCASFYPILKQVKDLYKDEITFQFVHFPLSQIHQNAQAAHRAAESASNQGKFWEMHDLLYENQNSWNTSTNVLPIFESYATQLSLDVAKFKTDYASATTNSIIQADIVKGQGKKVTGTPTFFLNDKLIEDNNTIASVKLLSEAIDKAIEEKTGKKPTPKNIVEPTSQQQQVTPSPSGTSD